MATHKEVDPRGFLLNDNDIGVDHLGESTFADAIAESVHHVDTPITIGIFAKWGSGKSFLLRHLESILKRYQQQSIVDDKRKERYPETRIKRSYIFRAILWTGCILVLFAGILATLLLAVKPGIYLHFAGIEYKTSSSNLGKYPNETANSTTDSAEPTTVGPPPYLQDLKIAGLILIPIEILLIFLVGCCGNSWLSPNYYGSCRLLTYGAFTKLPVRSSVNDIVEDPGQVPAQLLMHIRPGDERLAMAASEAEIFSRRYIFVDFKAWEYAGSDTLWAGIVTNITDAIEAEFGVITARMFRMLTIQDVPRSILNAGERTIYIELSNGSKMEEVLDMMKQYGVVTECERVEGEFAIRPGHKYWRIVYCCDGECRSAKECLAIEGVRYVENIATENTTPEKRRRRKKYHRGGPLRESRKELLKKKDNIEMKTFRNGGGVEDDKDVLDRLTVPPRTFCCNRFCAHFLKYPTMLLGLPRLIWWIIILLCSVLIPIIAYVIAEYLDLEVYRTYRTVPVIGQIFLWLPAGAAVTAFTIKFTYAMCHSQRKRINEALDGTKTKMADELGFMNKVKSEIQVVTKLIQCARFTHQKDYKIVITIDDLDRVPLKKVQAVLEAVSILLSDKSSPFICFIAVDPRIVVKCIEEGMGEALKQSKVTGHEYLKKIINLPICLPEISDSDKKRFIAGLIDQADHTITYREEENSKKRVPGSGNANTTTVDYAVRRCHSDNTLNIVLTDVECIDETDSQIDIRQFTLTRISNPYAHNNRTNKANGRNNLRPKEGKVPLAVELDHKKFLFHCREFIYHNEELHKHLQGNPRNLKRLFNVISLTACIINSFLKKRRRTAFIDSHARDDGNINVFIEERHKIERTARFAEDLVRWIILADQWPYRTSYVLQVIEDAEQRGSAGIENERIPDDWTIFEIFQNKVKGEYDKGDKSLLSLDADPDLFYSYLRLLKGCGFTTQLIKRLEKFTVNLDSSIRHSIAFQRDLTCLEIAKTEAAPEENDETEPSRLRNNIHLKPPEIVIGSGPEEAQMQLSDTDRRYSLPLLMHNI